MTTSFASLMMNVLVFVLCLQQITTLPLNKRETSPQVSTQTTPTNNTDDLQRLVQRALNDSLGGINFTLNITEITKQLLHTLSSAGSGCGNTRCKKRPQAYLIQEFMAANPQCFSLRQLEQVEVATGSPMYVVETNPKCVIGSNDFIIERPCSSPPKCSWSNGLNAVAPLITGEDHFPQYYISTDCQGSDVPICSPQQVTQRMYFLKRQADCDSDGYEIWDASDSVTVNIACGCVTD